ncbi:MAG: exosortase/archaeosortase family protein [Myxococcota bacterium]
MQRFTLETVLWIGLAVIFAPAVMGLAEHWQAHDYYNHGFLVPLVALASGQPLWKKLGPSQRYLPALAGLGLSLGLYAFGLLIGQVSLQGLALVAAVTCLVMFRGGPGVLRTFAFPLGFLLFMIPLPTSWVTPLIVSLQTIASQAAVAVLHAFDVPVLRDGNVIRLPGGGSLFVAEACSGITSLISLIPIGFLLARFTDEVFWRRAAIVLAVVPAALLGNAIRVIVTVYAANAVGIERATTGTLHDMAGLLTSAFAVVLVIAFGSLLRRLTEDGDPIAPPPATA